RVEGNPYVICGKNEGEHLVNIKNPWGKIRKKAGLEKLRLHDLRHNYASTAVATGHHLKVVGALLGHSEIKNDRLSLPPADTAGEDAWHLFVLRTPEREKLKAHLQNHGIGFDVHYPLPPHQQKALASFNHLSLPVTEEIHRTVLSIPLNSTLTDEDADHIISTLNQF
ncbi:MAG: DegT/DnrJ/EryC1/StrS family aminotransferase, partial [Leadbetterella sp.]|nr:DegT/DnrJ/EryC1/StrS family aminotransferase [Leadbetterella sp.]